MASYATEQEAFWAGGFGNDYIERNRGLELLAANINFFSSALSRTERIGSCLEFGANIGLNLMALKTLHPDIEASGIEINPVAAEQLRKVLNPEQIYHQSILDFVPLNKWDLVFSKTVLIHINPNELPGVYDKIFEAAGKYILLAEYYSQSPVEISYRGHRDRLFKRDFAGEMLKRHPQLRLVDYGFLYRGDTKYPQDDITWFLLTL